MAEKVAEVLTEYGLIDSLLGMAMDNASNNDTLLTTLPDLLPSTAAVGSEYQIRCFGHILNLICKAFLSLFDTSKKAIKADGNPVLGGAPCVEEDIDEDSEEDIGEDEDIVEDQQEERDNGDWSEIEALCASLTEVELLDDAAKVVGRTTMKKVCGLMIPSPLLTLLL